MKNKRKKTPTMLDIKYNVIIKSIDKKTGKVVKKTEIHNMIVNDGLNLIRNFMAGDVVDNPSAIALGTDVTAVAAEQTELLAEVIRETATISKPDDYEVQYEKVFSVGSGESYAIKEVGLFDNVSVSGSTMFSRLLCNNTLDTDTNLSVQISYTIGRS
jgi:hypothetical protein